jgi:hypothetical protein
MNEEKFPPVTKAVEVQNLIEEPNEHDVLEVSDEEADEYFENSQSRKVDGIFDVQGAAFPARYWHTRWLNDVAHLSRMGKALTSANAIKKLSDDENAKALAELWCIQTPMAIDIENFLKKHPVDNVWYFVSILTQIEKNGISKGERVEQIRAKEVRIKNGRKGGKATSEVNDQSKTMRQVKEHWTEWQAQEEPLGTATDFADRMIALYGKNVTHKNITDNCTKWKKERLSQISNPFS